MNSFVSFFVVTWILSTACGQQFGQIVDGPCSRFQVSSQFMGVWYVYASYDYADILGVDCLVAFYRLTPDGNAINTETGKNLTTNERKNFMSNYRFDQPGIGHYTYGQGTVSQQVFIPVCDYIHYYIEYICVDIAGGKSDCYVGLYTRLPIPSAITVARINEFLNTHNIDKSKLRYIVHDKTRCSL